MREVPLFITRGNSFKNKELLSGSGGTAAFSAAARSQDHMNPRFTKLWWKSTPWITLTSRGRTRDSRYRASKCRTNACTHPLAEVNGLGGIVGPAFTNPLGGRAEAKKEEEERLSPIHSNDFS